jgi:glycine oxidase
VTDNSQQIVNWSKKWSIDARYIDNRNDILAIEKTVGDIVNHGLWMPDINQIRNPEFVKALKASFELHSIPYHENCAVEELIIDNNKVAGVRTKRQRYSADKVIIASGAWSAQFNVTRASVNVSPVKGQMIMYKGKPGMVNRIILSEGHYIIPRKDGRILAGSTLEKMGFDKTISSSAFDELNQAAVELVPMLEDLQVEKQWAGLRPGTEKGVPYICQHDDIEGLFVHAGHFRNGIVLGLGSVDLMADIILGRDPWCDTRPYMMTAEH